MRSADSRSRRWAGVDLRPGSYASFAMSAGRHSRRASADGMPIQWASPPCSPWHRDPHLGRSSRRMAVPRPTSRTVTAGPGCGARDPPLWRRFPATRVTDCGAQTRVICAYPKAAPPLDCAELRRRPSNWAYRAIGPRMIACASSPLLPAVLRTANGVPAGPRRRAARRACSRSAALVTTPTALQRQALELLGVSHRLGVASSAPRPRAPESPGKRPNARITGGNYGLIVAAHDGEPAQVNCGAAAVGRAVTPAGSVP